MVLLIVLIAACYFGYTGLTVGVYPVLMRTAMGALAVAAAVGFAGPLRETIPSENAYLYGACLLTLAIAAYALQRGLTEFCLSERRIALPEIADRIAGAAVGFFGGLMLTGFACLVLVTIPLPDWMRGTAPQLRQAAHFGVASVRIVGAVAGSGDPISLDVIAPEPAEPDGDGAEDAGERKADDATRSSPRGETARERRRPDE